MWWLFTKRNPWKIWSNNITICQNTMSKHKHTKSHDMMKNCANLLLMKSFYEEKVVCLFCLSSWHLPNPNAYCCVLGTFGKLSRNSDAPIWFHNVLTYIIKNLKIEHNFIKKSFKPKQIIIGEFGCTLYSWKPLNEYNLM